MILKHCNKIFFKKLSFSNFSVDLLKCLFFRHNRKMSQSELSSVGSESPGNSGRDERGSLIGERGRSIQRNRNINRAASKGKGSSIGKKDPGDPGEKRNLAEAGNPFPGFP